MDPAVLSPNHSTPRPVSRLTLGLARLYANVRQHESFSSVITRSAQFKRVPPGGKGSIRDKLEAPRAVLMRPNRDDVVDQNSLGSDEIVKAETSLHLLSPSETPSPFSQPPELLVRRYRPLAQLGNGAFATTILADDIFSASDPPKQVAIKILAREYSHIGSHEALLLSDLRKLRSQHFVEFVSSFYDNGCMHLVLECLDASQPVTLPDCAHTVGHFSLVCPDRIRVLAKIALQLLSAMHELHSQGWIHADLKPENIMYVLPRSADDNRHKIKIIDLGNATRQADTAAYHDNFDIQSVGYRAPEVLLGDAGFDVRIDIWSVGVILLELLLAGDEAAGLKASDGKIVKGGSRIEVVTVIKHWFGSLECYRQSASSWLEEFGDGHTVLPSLPKLEHNVEVKQESGPQVPIGADTEQVKLHTPSPPPPQEKYIRSSERRRRRAADSIVRDYVRRKRKHAISMTWDNLHRKSSASLSPAPPSASKLSSQIPVTQMPKNVRPRIHLTAEMLSASPSPPLRLLSSSPPPISSSRSSPFGKLLLTNERAAERKTNANEVKMDIQEEIVLAVPKQGKVPNEQNAKVVTNGVQPTTKAAEPPKIAQLLNDPRRSDLSRFLRRLVAVDYHKRPAAVEALKDEFLTKELLGTWGKVLLQD
ncbi:kinase-like domain-containing protein [Lipomyces tetrasporus]|uniref:Kinase-like domain-containing protein n=1 Tax=Lipomyces tetrasporus TaxID=54092 RepID=A0AAD7R1S4_9ASCO|nr:kinase-like domain-containing protein [Lipomyces tetrasporus]KAJ8104252.1 kinase-like domain-containing protein [Lipomyces tetrasporus]